jgi:hypothetical protein
MLLIALVNNGFSLFDDNVRNNDMIDYEIMKKFYTQKPLDYNNISFVDDVIFDGLTRAEWIELLEIGDAELKKFDFLFDQMIYAGILFKTQPQKNTAYKYYFCSELVRLFFNYYRP